MRILNTIHFGNLRGDLFGGVVTAIIALPMALAFGVASGAGPAAGLYGAILVGLFASLFGGSPTLISEPTGPMTVVMTAVIANLMAANPEDGMAMAFTVVMMAGLFQILFGALRLGRYVTLMPYTVISGFMSGIGIILIVLQLGPFLGQASPDGGVIGSLTHLPELIANIQPSETFLAVLTVALIVLYPARLKRYLPPQLLALVVGSLLSIWIFGQADLRRIGEIPAVLPSLQLPVFSVEQWRLMVIDALVLAMLGAIDALLTSMIADSLTRSEHDSNKEIVGQGLGNLASGLFGGMPGAGATMGTVANIQTGARSALSGLTRAALLIAVVLGASDLTEVIPLAVLAGIAVKVGFDIIDWDFLRRAHRVSLRGAFIMYGVILLTVFVDLITAVGVGIFVANVITIDRLSKLQAKDIKSITGGEDSAELSPTEATLFDRVRGQVLVLQLNGPMIFAVAKTVSRFQNAAENYRTIILDLSNVPLLGVSSSLALETLVKDARERNVEVLIAGASGQADRRLKRLRIPQFINEANFVPTREAALRKAVEDLDPRTA
jgi:SulP family sulfate permease